MCEWCELFFMRASSISPVLCSQKNRIQGITRVRNKIMFIIEKDHDNDIILEDCTICKFYGLLEFLMILDWFCDVLIKIIMSYDIENGIFSLTYFLHLVGNFLDWVTGLHYNTRFIEDSDICDISPFLWLGFDWVCFCMAWVFSGVLGCSQVFTGILGHSWVFSGVLWCSHVFSGVLGCTRVHLGVLRCAWGCSDVLGCAQIS